MDRPPRRPTGSRSVGGLSTASSPPCHSGGHHVALRSEHARSIVRRYAEVTRTTAKAARLTRLVQLMELRPRGVVELAREFGVSRRSIERDLHDLRELGHPLEERDDHTYGLPTRGSALNEVEALAVHSATRLLVHTGIGERHYRAALEKLAKQLPEPARASLIASVERLEPAPEDRILDLVAQAWFQGRVLRCTYHSASSGTSRAVELQVYYYELNRRNLEPYVLAYDRLHHHEVRTYKLTRMDKARLLSDTYAIPDHFDPHEHMAGAWGVVVGDPVQVRLRVDPSVAFWFREQTGRERALRIVDEHPDGALEAELSANLAVGGDVHELLSFLLGWGSKIEVLGPPEVRERVRAELAAAAARYLNDVW